MENDTKNFKSVFVLSFGPSPTEKQWSKRTQKRGKPLVTSEGRRLRVGRRYKKKKCGRARQQTARKSGQRRWAAPLARGKRGWAVILTPIRWSSAKHLFQRLQRLYICQQVWHRVERFCTGMSIKIIATDKLPGWARCHNREPGCLTLVRESPGIRPAPVWCYHVNTP